jgi:Flp pilus assembly protein TadD
MDSVLPLLASLAIALPAQGVLAEEPDHEVTTTAARHAAARGEWLGAAMLLEAPAEAFPQDRSLQVEHAWYLLRAGEGEKAERAYRAALALNPRSLDAQLGLVDALMAQGRYPQASSTAVGFLAGRPGEVGLLNRKALASFWLGDLDLSERVYRHSLSVEPGNADAIAGLGWIAWKRGELPVARERFAEALRQDPENTAALAGVATLPPETLWVPQAYVSLETFDGNGTTTSLLSLAVGLDLHLMDRLGVKVRYRHFSSLGALPDAGYSQDEGWALASYAWQSLRAELLAGVAVFSAGSAAADPTSAASAAILGGALHLRAFADLFASATYSAYSVGDSTQLDLGATIPVTGWLAVLASGRLQLGNGTRPSGMLEAQVWRSGWSLAAGGTLGSQLHPVDWRTLSVWNLASEIAWEAHARAGFPIAGPVSGYASYEFEKLSGSITTANGQRFTLGLIGNF